MDRGIGNNDRIPEIFLVGWRADAPVFGLGWICRGLECDDLANESIGIASLTDYVIGSEESINIPLESGEWKIAQLIANGNFIKPLN